MVSYRVRMLGASSCFGQGFDSPRVHHRVRHARSPFRREVVLCLAGAVISAHRESAKLSSFYKGVVQLVKHRSPKPNLRVQILPLLPGELRRTLPLLFTHVVYGEHDMGITSIGHLFRWYEV